MKRQNRAITRFFKKLFRDWFNPLKLKQIGSPLFSKTLLILFFAAAPAVCFPCVLNIYQAVSEENLDGVFGQAVELASFSVSLARQISAYQDVTSGIDQLKTLCTAARRSLEDTQNPNRAEMERIINSITAQVDSASLLVSQGRVKEAELALYKVSGKLKDSFLISDFSKPRNILLSMLLAFPELVAAVKAEKTDTSAKLAADLKDKIILLGKFLEPEGSDFILDQYKTIRLMLENLSTFLQKERDQDPVFLRQKPETMSLFLDYDYIALSTISWNAFEQFIHDLWKEGIPDS